MHHKNIKKVLITDPIDPHFVQSLRNAGCEVDEKKLTKDQLITQIADYDALVVRSGTQVTADVIVAGKNLKLIGRAGTGVDNIDVPAATKHGVWVMNTPGEYSRYTDCFSSSIDLLNNRLEIRQNVRKI